MPTPIHRARQLLVVATLAASVATIAACSKPADEKRSGRPADAPAFASSGTMADEGKVQPVDQRPAKPLRIAVLGLESSPFWLPVRSGVQRAATELADRNVTVEWIVPGEAHTVDVFGRAIDAAVVKKYDALATIAGDAGVAAYIDRAVKAGIPVATFNSETDTPNGRTATRRGRRRGS
jgi:ABC-type sugar transport system substrate-binding protein